MKEETKEKKNDFILHDAIISWACFIWAILSIILMFVFSGNSQVTFSIMTFGQLFIVLGIIGFVRKNITGPLFTVTGIVCVILPAISQWGALFNKTLANFNNYTPAFMSTAICLIGLAMLVAPGVLEDMSKRRCKRVVTGECVDTKSVTLSDGKVAYAPVYSYELDGKVYTKCTEKYRKDEKVEIGSKLELRVNEKKPEDVYIPTSKAGLMIIYIIGMAFLMAGAGMIMTVLAS